MTTGKKEQLWPCDFIVILSPTYEGVKYLVSKFKIWYKDRQKADIERMIHLRWFIESYKVWWVKPLIDNVNYSNLHIFTLLKLCFG